MGRVIAVSNVVIVLVVLFCSYNPYYEMKKNFRR